MSCPHVISAGTLGALREKVCRLPEWNKYSAWSPVLSSLIFRLTSTEVAFVVTRC